jgi:hypothetical protein
MAYDVETVQHRERLSTITRKSIWETEHSLPRLRRFPCPLAGPLRSNQVLAGLNRQFGFDSGQERLWRKRNSYVGC